MGGDELGVAGYGACLTAHRVTVRFMDGERIEGTTERLVLGRQGLQLTPEDPSHRIAWVPLTSIKYVWVHETGGPVLTEDPREAAGLMKVVVQFGDGERLRTYQDSDLEQTEEGFKFRIWNPEAAALVRLLVPVHAVKAIYEVEAWEETKEQQEHRAGTGHHLTAKPVMEAARSQVDELPPELHSIATAYLQRLATVEDQGLSSPDGSVFEAALRRQVQRLLREDGIHLDEAGYGLIVRSIMRDARGFGPLDTLLEDPAVSEIMVNSYDDVFVERNGILQPSDVRFQSEEQLLQIIGRMAASVGRRIDTSSPMLDARLPDGSRLNAVLRPLAVRGPSLTIRKFRSFLANIQDMVLQRTLSSPMAEFLSWAVEGRLNILVSGGTGSGKTTTLNALAAAIPPTQRLITIEDAAELQINHPHVVGLECRPPNVEGKGELTTRQLVRNSLRMRPDRLIIGEVRGAEALDMLQAMNTGHDGSMSTIHSNSARDAFSRLETMVLAGSVDLPLEAVRAQLTAAVNLVVHQARLVDGGRKIIQISEVLGYQDGLPLLENIFELHKGEFCATGYIPKAVEKASFYGVRMPARLFERQTPDPVIRVLSAG